MGTEDGMGMDHGWDGNGEKEMVHCLLTPASIYSRLCEKAMRIDGENRTYMPTYLYNNFTVPTYFLTFTGHHNRHKKFHENVKNKNKIKQIKLRLGVYPTVTKTTVWVMSSMPVCNTF